MIHKKKFTIDNFDFASSKISDDNEALIKDFARIIVFGLPPIPPVSGIKEVLVIGHGKGTNPEKHAVKRGIWSRVLLEKYMESFGAEEGDIAKVFDGEPVVIKVSSNSKVTGKDRKVTILIKWITKPKDDRTTFLARQWAKNYFSRHRMSGWEWIGVQSFNSTSHEKAGKRKVWVGPEKLWSEEIRSAPLVEKYLRNYAALLHFAPLQGVPNLKNPVKDKRDFEKKFKGKLDRRIRQFEIEEFLTALYTSKPKFGSGPPLRNVRLAVAKMILRFQGTVIRRISNDRKRKIKGLLGKEELKPVAEGGGPVVQKAMIKNAIYTAISTLMSVNRDTNMDTKLASTVTKNCGTIVGFAILENVRLHEKDKKISNKIIDLALIPVGGGVASIGGKIGLNLFKTVVESLIGASQISLNKIKTEFERQANTIDDLGVNPGLTSNIKREIVQEFRDGCDTVFQPK